MAPKKSHCIEKSSRLLRSNTSEKIDVIIKTKTKKKIMAKKMPSKKISSLLKMCRPLTVSLVRCDEQIQLLLRSKFEKTS